MAVRTLAETDTGQRTLADQLNGRGIPGPTSGPWYAAIIKEMFKNDSDFGWLVIGMEKESGGN